VVIGYLFALFVLSKIHRWFLKFYRKKIRVCVFEYDHIWYLIAKVMYTLNVDMQNH